MLDRKISCVVVAYEMRREIERTVYSLSHRGQQRIKAKDYEIIVVDNGSKEPIERDLFPDDIVNLRVVRMPDPHQSPAKALNFGFSLAEGAVIVSMIDGARMASPGCLYWFNKAFSLSSNPAVVVPSFHIGPDVQNKSIQNGYNQDIEDALFESIDWKSNGYALFSISKGLDPSSTPEPWFQPIFESNMIGVTRQDYEALGGFGEAFTSPGGGAVNLDFFKRIVEQLARPVFTIVGEGTFHQVHGGVSTNIEESKHPWAEINAEYKRIRGEDLVRPKYQPLLVGSMGEESWNWLQSYEVNRRRKSPPNSSFSISEACLAGSVLLKRLLGIYPK